MPGTAEWHVLIPVGTQRHKIEVKFKSVRCLSDRRSTDVSGCQSDGYQIATIIPLPQITILHDERTGPAVA
jgi:hypothetical protein